MTEATEVPAAGSVPMVFPPFPVGVDIELTSRCNARCTFCPRDETPHQGLMDEATFAAALGRVVEYRDALLEFQRVEPDWFDTSEDTIFVSLCGMGEPLLHPRVVEYVGRIAAAGLRPIVNTNGALLTPELADALMDAGLAIACLNVGEIDEQYEAVYHLPFERTRANVEHFLAAAPGRCVPVVVLVDHRDDVDHAAAMRAYWTERGATAFLPFKLVNRAGSLEVDEQIDAWDTYGEVAKGMLRAKGGWTSCWVPFLYPFIGYDGNYYLCSSDWRKEVALGTVVGHSLVDLLDDKAAQVQGRSPICAGCTHEPTNALAQSLANAADGRATDADATPFATADGLLAGLDHFSACLTAMRAHLPRSPADSAPTNRRLIPVRS